MRKIPMRYTLAMVSILIAQAASGQVVLDCRNNSPAIPCVEYRETGKYDGPLKLLFEEGAAPIKTNPSADRGVVNTPSKGDIQSLELCEPYADLAESAARTRFISGIKSLENQRDFMLSGAPNRVSAAMMIAIFDEAERIVFWGDPLDRVNDFRSSVMDQCLDLLIDANP